MPDLMPRDIVAEVDAVLRGVQEMPNSRGRAFLTAYQILDQLHQPTKGRLIAERGAPGSGAGEHYSAASVVSDAAEMISGVEILFLETTSIQIIVNESDITPGNKYVGLYRV
jgi:hypothetical protein